MSNRKPEYEIQADHVEIRLPQDGAGFLRRVLRGAQPKQTFLHLSDDQRDMIFAIADLRSWGDIHEGEVEIRDDCLRLTHDAVASLSTGGASALGLPQDVHLTLKTDVTGTLGSPNFKLEYEWIRSGRRELPKRQGAILYTSEGERRVPLWMKRALDLSDGFDPSLPLEDHWRILADFRRALEPEEDVPGELPENRSMASLSMTSFLRGLEVRIANRFSISPDRSLGQFDIVPYSTRSLEEKAVTDTEISEKHSELAGEALAAFQYKLQSIGARSAYQLGNNSYLVIDSSSTPILEEMVRVQKADREERKEFIQNPRAFITEAVTRHLESIGAFDELDDAGREELIEATAQPAFVESREYSERVTGVVQYVRPSVDFEGSGTAWLPEVFSEIVADRLSEMPAAELEVVRNQMADALTSERPVRVQIGDEEVEATPERLVAVEAEIKRRNTQQDVDVSPHEEENETDKPGGPLILDSIDNFEAVSWQAKLSPRTPHIATDIPDVIVTELREHQKESFNWAVQAWQNGLPGILNADEQGLGKTLQTICFLKWLQENMQKPNAEERGPIMVVAPTSLLRNWEQEVDRHVASRKFGHLVRLYGSSLAGHKVRNAKGTETREGLPLLDLEWLDEALAEGRAHRYWFLTTYTTLANYQHSLGSIRFSTIVFDEIQNIKNKDTIASRAAEAMNADFRIGLTGTPIENTTMDLWTIMDRLAPGALGSGIEFRDRYREPDESNMAELHGRVFKPLNGFPALGLRRLKNDVATELPKKEQFLHPLIMPAPQARTYDEARNKLASGGPGAALKMLHHIRSVSVHPGINQDVPPEDFIAMSARLSAVMKILKRIQANSERVLVFIEHRNMQFRFAEIVRQYFGLERIDIINGETPIPKRQAIVNRFQMHLEHDGGFDLLILGPKAAGTGLTLTAATHVIHLSRWWNPAVEEQCNDRVHRIGQEHQVKVHIPIAIHPGYREHTFDCLLQSLMQRKRRMAEQALWPMGDTKADLEGLQKNMDAEVSNGVGDIIAESIKAMFKRDGVQEPLLESDGAYRIP